MIDELTHDHDRIRAIADRLDAYLQADHAPVDIEFSRLRWAFTRHLMAHLARERAAFSARPGTAEQSCLDHTLDRLLHEYMTEWDVAAIQRRWRQYRTASRTLLSQLRYRMKREEEHLFPQIAGRVASSGTAASA